MTSYSDPPFTGKRILITRDAASNAKLEVELRELGAEVLNWPCFETVSLLDEASMAAAFENLKSQNWLIFTSQNSVQYFLEGCVRFNLTLNDFKNCSIACVGSETSQILNDAGWAVQLIPTVFSQLGLSDCKEFTQTRNLKITLLQAKAGRDDFVNQLHVQHDIQALFLYETKFIRQTPAKVQNLLEGDVHWMLFYSPSAVQSFAANFTADQLKCIFLTALPVVIGATTLAALKCLPIKNFTMAAESTHNGMICELRRINAQKDLFSLPNQKC